MINLITSKIAKVTNWIINILDLGSGYTWPGHIGLKISPYLLKHYLSRFKHGVALISGTNGKTTTAKITAHLLETAGYSVCHNKSGANLLNGIASAVLLDTDFWGRSRSDIGVFEVDEFTLPLLLAQCEPRSLVLLNLSRDQLDRYGEIDITFEKWKSAIYNLSANTTLFLSDHQSSFKDLAAAFSGKVEYFDSDDFYLNKTSLQGDFNAYNVNASVLMCRQLGVSEESILKGLSEFEVAYGRGELIEWQSNIFSIFLAKNPASFNHNLKFFNRSDVTYPKSVLFILNDNIPDGRDVSWIYDIDASQLSQFCVDREIYVSGTRYLDMAIRLKYAGVSVRQENISSNLLGVLKRFDAGDVLALPNYSAMLELRKLLKGKAIL